MIGFFFGRFPRVGLFVPAFFVHSSQKRAPLPSLTQQYFNSRLFVIALLVV